MRNEELDTIIEKSFRTEPTFHLPVDFVQKVTFSIVKREQWKSDLSDYISLTSILLCLLSIVGGLYYYLDKAVIIQVLSFITGNLSQVAFTVFILNFILFTDKVLLPLLFNRWNTKA